VTLILQIVNGYILEDFVPRFHRLTEEKMLNKPLYLKHFHL